MLLSRKSILAILAVIDVGLHSRSAPVSAKALATRHGLPPRHLEPVLQALVHDGILKGMRGPRGGYALARDERDITADQILRAAGAAADDEPYDLPRSGLVAQVILPALAEAELSFTEALSHIDLAALIHQAERVA
jgi:Rrf2 family iron-sulfur cluster assembly transcriptional regulator